MPPSKVPFHLRQRFRISFLTPFGRLDSVKNAKGFKAAAATAGVSPLYLKRKLAEGGDNTFTRRVIYDDGSWCIVKVERIDRCW
jgi:hypothetical protein